MVPCYPLGNLSQFFIIHTGGDLLIVGVFFCELQSYLLQFKSIKSSFIRHSLGEKIAALYQVLNSVFTLYFLSEMHNLSP